MSVDLCFTFQKESGQERVRASQIRTLWIEVEGKLASNMERVTGAYRMDWFASSYIRPMGMNDLKLARLNTLDQVHLCQEFTRMSGIER